MKQRRHAILFCAIARKICKTGWHPCRRIYGDSTQEVQKNLIRPVRKRSWKAHRRGSAPAPPGIYRFAPPASKMQKRFGAGGPKRKIPGGLGNSVPQNSFLGTICITFEESDASFEFAPAPREPVVYAPASHPQIRTGFHAAPEPLRCCRAVGKMVAHPACYPPNPITFPQASASTTRSPSRAPHSPHAAS